MTTKENVHAVAESLGLTMSAKFVPWSLSRNAGEKLPSLNWKVTILHKGRAFLTTDYMSGCGHCPSYKVPIKELGHANSIDRTNAIKKECETGRGKHGQVLEPELADVLHSLAMDSSALDASGFEDWAAEYDYDTNSRAAEATYKACLDIGLKLRAALGDAGFQALREAMQDY